jgi:hypothetical protein
MPKGAKTLTLGYTSFHRCACGYDIEDAQPKLIEMKKRLHRKKCKEWNKEDVIENNWGVIDVPPCHNHNNINRDKNRERNEAMIIQSLDKK